MDKNEIGLLILSVSTSKLKSLRIKIITACIMDANTYPKVAMLRDLLKVHPVLIFIIIVYRHKMIKKAVTSQVLS